MSAMGKTNAKMVIPHRKGIKWAFWLESNLLWAYTDTECYALNPGVGGWCEITNFRPHLKLSDAAGIAEARERGFEVGPELETSAYFNRAAAETSLQHMMDDQIKKSLEHVWAITDAELIKRIGTALDPHIRQVVREEMAKPTTAEVREVAKGDDWRDKCKVWKPNAREIWWSVYSPTGRHAIHTDGRWIEVHDGYFGRNFRTEAAARLALVIACVPPDMYEVGPGVAHGGKTYQSFDSAQPTPLPDVGDDWRDKCSVRPFTNEMIVQWGIDSPSGEYFLCGGKWTAHDQETRTRGAYPFEADARAALAKATPPPEAKA